MDTSPAKFLKENAQRNSKVHVVGRDGREVEGVLCAADRHFNLFLTSATETRVQKPCSTRGVKRRKEEKVFKRSLGTVFIRGDMVISVNMVEKSAEDAQEMSRTM